MVQAHLEAHKGDIPKGMSPLSCNNVRCIPTEVGADGVMKVYSLQKDEAVSLQKKGAGRGVRNSKT